MIALSTTAPTRIRRIALAFGPGVVVMLADTDAGSVITAAQSGTRWGYQLLLFQFLIIPVLFMVQELTVRLGLGTGKGYGELILKRFGRSWALLATVVLAVSCLGALVTQLSGLAGIGQMFGIPAWQTVTIAVLMIFAMVWTGSYHSVERVAIILGLFEMAFFVVAWKAAPDGADMAAQIRHVPLSDPGYLYLLAASLGTSVMPWTIFYQQSALIDKGLGIGDMKLARIDTLLGAIFCQAVTVAVLVAAAATIGKHQSGLNLDSVPQIADAFAAVLGGSVGRMVFAVGLCGGALVATVVVCLASAWAIGEVTGIHHSLEHHPAEAPWFYAAFGVILAAGGTVVASGINAVRLSIAVGVLNALLLPVVLGFIFLLARSELPEALRLKGGYAVAVGTIFVVTAGFGLYSGVFGTLG
jgi:Mn2+/Fe2+ NRAMP family transporter